MSASAYWKSKGHDKEAAKDLMLSMYTTNDEKHKHVNELEACNTSEESMDVEDEYIDYNFMYLAPNHICKFKFKSIKVITRSKQNNVY